jgi:hypothetical protein
LRKQAFTGVYYGLVRRGAAGFCVFYTIVHLDVNGFVLQR